MSLLTSLPCLDDDFLLSDSELPASSIKPDVNSRLLLRSFSLIFFAKVISFVCHLQSRGFAAEMEIFATFVNSKTGVSITWRHRTVLETSLGINKIVSISKDSCPASAKWELPKDPGIESKSGTEELNFEFLYKVAIS